MLKNYNGLHFSEIEQYNALTQLLSNSKKTRTFPIFSIENILNNEGLLLFLLNQKKYIVTTREKNPFGNTMYKLTRKGKKFLEKFFFSKSDYLFLIIINFIIFILPIFTILGINIIKKELDNNYGLILDLNLTIYFVVIWLIIIIYAMIKNRKKRNKKYMEFKKQYNIN